jgi:hypothetical protein
MTHNQNVHRAVCSERNETQLLTVRRRHTSAWLLIFRVPSLYLKTDQRVRKISHYHMRVRKCGGRVLQDKMKLQQQRELSDSTISRCKVRMPLNRKRLNWEGCNVSLVGFLRNNPGSVRKDSEKWGKPVRKAVPRAKNRTWGSRISKAQGSHCIHRSSWNCLPMITKDILFPRASNPHLRESFWATVIRVKFRISSFQQHLSWGPGETDWLQCVYLQICTRLWTWRDRVVTVCIPLDLHSLVDLERQCLQCVYLQICTRLWTRELRIWNGLELNAAKWPGR